MQREPMKTNPSDYLSVSTLTKYLKRKFDKDPYLERVFLSGEISNLRLRPNTHQYFSLKDSKAKISAVMFRNVFQQLKFTPKDGMKVLVIGRITLYEQSGNYQINIEHMEPDGVGALYQALEEIKVKLSQEGLFNLTKRPIKRYPKKIAIVTSPSGAVIRDIISTVSRRYPIVELILFPTLVQGEKAAQDIVHSLKKINEDDSFDTVILARGGGSIEDLWPFNEEIVARQLVKMNAPVISSVGHETDTTIADLAADLRAATPTAAAELAVPVLSDELLRIKQHENQLIRLFDTLIEHQQLRLNHALQSYVLRTPLRLYETFSLQLDNSKRNLDQAILNVVQTKKDKFTKTERKFIDLSPKHQLYENQQKLLLLIQRLETVTQQTLLIKQHQFQQLVTTLDVLSPLKTMSRGYSFVTQKDNVVHSVKEISLDDELIVNMVDGEVITTVKEIQEKSKE